MATTNRPVTAVAAIPREFSGLLAHATLVRALRTPLSYAVEADIDGRRWLLLANGEGPARAGAAAAYALREARTSALVSTGYCGGLDPALKVGDIFVADQVLDDAGRYWPASTTGPASGTLLSQDRVAITEREKCGLFASGARAVEMEAAAVARAASQGGTPFHCIRVVSDSALETLPLDFNLYRDSTGRFRRGRILAAALARPSSFGGLLRLNKASLAAARSLGDFLACCQF